MIYLHGETALLRFSHNTFGTELTVEYASWKDFSSFKVIKNFNISLSLHELEFGSYEFSSILEYYQRNFKS